ncbi:hypothetical protein BO78DRAFT_423297 [Aspergillus sclerotiicarbonarius CBS 121057]|uniref:Uncharacterized protein n=1 Tax=Aspergillus sclerotiicarbonarius (strain CBS 121057 / IBT 28362) TaxID=1448318 RepID=A0A319F7Y7_ASPSB|nr:hypothetical protein BO78DRAFT_423297 [Aspergillus sclerotiicarbonarius CBS 121057]
MEFSLPFIPTDAEQQQPLAQEYLNNAGNLATATLQARRANKGQSGSTWGTDEVHAVRAIPIINVEPKRIVPERHFPRSDDQNFARLRQSARAADIDALKTYSGDEFQGNPFQLFFEDLAELVTTFTSEETIKNAHRRRISDSSVETDLSTSSNEGKGESVSVNAVKNFIKAILPRMGELRHLPTQGPVKPSLMCYSATARFEWKMAGVSHVAINDGFVGVNFQGNFSGSNRKTEIPVASLECKTRHAGGIRRGSGQPEHFIDEIFAREVAELIGNMAAQRSVQGLLTDQHQDQQSFVISMHGALLYISAAYFSPEYIQYIEANDFTQLDVSRILLWVRRSVHFDLKDVGQRVQALELVWALLDYIASGEARLNIVSAAINAV